MSSRSRKLVLGATVAVPLVLLGIVAWRCSAGCDLPAECAATERLPRIRPDYSGVTIPPNIAPLNFLVEEPALEYRVRIYGALGEDILIASRSPSVIIPPRPWRELLGQNRGGQIALDVYAKGDDGRWSRFDSIKNDVAREEIDSHLVYRRLGIIANSWRHFGIYQRNLENCNESPIITNDAVDGCLNCHTFRNNNPHMFSFHVRYGRDAKKNRAGMIVARDGQASRLKTKSEAAPWPAGVHAWHPTAPVAAFAMTYTTQCFRGAGPEIRDVFDMEGDLAFINADSGATATSPEIYDPNRLESFPNWSPDGKTLYFVSAKARWKQPDKPPTDEDIKKLMYDLMCVRYDAEKNTWSKPETVLSAAKTGMSITEPRASPDGRYLLLCMSDYGGFPLHRPSSDLYMMDLASGKYRRLECNSDQSESWHCWSSNSRWIVFSSRRDTGLLARPYFSYIDSEGREHKPFVLPQEDPTFHDAFFRNYNVPELITGPVTVSQKELLRAIDAVDAANGGPPKSEPPARASY